MKVLIIFATLLLVPIIMKFQEETLNSRVLPILTTQAEELLARGGVADSYVEINYMDATVGGRVESWATAERLTKQVLSLRGIRQVTNQFLVRGSMQATRKGGLVMVSGMIPEGWLNGLGNESGKFDFSELQERDTTLLTVGSPLEWAAFLEQYFEGPGDRSFQFDGQRLILAGEATPELAKTITKTASALVGADAVEPHFQLHPSRYHFSLREVESPLDGEALRALQRSLLESRISFQPGTTTLNQAGEKVLQDLVAQFLSGNSGLQFVIGAYPEPGGDKLALARAEVVMDRLVDAGLPAVSLQATAYEMTEDSSGFAGQVEVLLR